MTTELVVFAGPTISTAEIHAIFPEAEVLPPVACGDVLNALYKFNPKKIAIIDGYFENIGSVWHKEIIFAMQQNVEVYGAASMGALRAAELHELGMMGIGKIFEAYCSGEIEDDDEVTILHRPEMSNYEPITDAMVNIRATIEKALALKVINDLTASQILAAAKNFFYKQRILSEIIKQCLVDYSDNEEEIKKFSAWLAEDNYVDQKKLDAVALLHFIQSKKDDFYCNAADSIKETFLVKKLLEKALCEPENTLDPIVLKQHPPEYIRYTRLLAYLIKTLDHLQEKLPELLSIIASPQGVAIQGLNKKFMDLATQECEHENIFQHLLIFFEPKLSEQFQERFAEIEKAMPSQHVRILKMTSIFLFHFEALLSREELRWNFVYKKLFVQNMIGAVKNVACVENLILNEEFISTFLILKNYLNNSAENFLVEKHDDAPGKFYYRLAMQLYDQLK